MKSYLNIEGLKAPFGDFMLGPLSLSLDKKGYLILLGPTGCGKSSLLKVIAGIERSAGGIIEIDSSDIGGIPPNKRRIGYVSQVGDLFPHLTVRQNVAFGLSYLQLAKSEKKARLERFLSLFNLTAVADQKAFTLSGGEGKRVAMARSLIIEPHLLLLDEPLGMLDHNARCDMLAVLKMIHEEIQTTTIHVTHDRQEAWMIADKCAVMNEGSIIQCDTVSNLFNSPESLFTALFLGGENILEASFSGRLAKTKIGAFELPEPVAFKRGWVMVRPENIMMFSGDEKQTLKGAVDSIENNGEFISLSVKMSNSVTIKSVIGHQSARGIAFGQEIRIGWHESDLHAIRGE